MGFKASPRTYWRLHLSAAADHHQYADSFVHVASDLCADRSVLDRDRPAFYLLAATAIELALKSLCLSYGVAPNRLRDDREVRHSLARLYGEAIKAGALHRFVDESAELCLRLSDYHQDAVFRYVPAHVTTLQLPEPEWTLRVAAYLTERAGQALEA